MSFTVERRRTPRRGRGLWLRVSAVARSLVQLIKPTPESASMLFDRNRAAPPPRQPPVLGRTVGSAELARKSAFPLAAEGRSIAGKQLAISGGALP